MLYPAVVRGAGERAVGWLVLASIAFACGDDGRAADGSGSAEAGDGGGPFVDTPDGGGIAYECDLWAQDCPVGEKCMPWAQDGGDSWNATHCTTVADEPGEPGDPCTAVGGPVSGEDDCARGSMCWDVDDAGAGTCVALCEGSADAPLCAAPDHGCSISNGGVLILCVPYCDPLAQDCPAGAACYPEDRGFFCSPDASEGSGTFGDPCAYVNVCDPGFWCAAWSDVPGCENEDGCCSAICDPADPACPGAGQICEAYPPAGSAPPGHGLCVIPD